MTTAAGTWQRVLLWSRIGAAHAIRMARPRHRKLGSRHRHDDLSPVRRKVCRHPDRHDVAREPPQRQQGHHQDHKKKTHRGMICQGRKSSQARASQAGVYPASSST